MNKFEYKNLAPFKWFVLENFPFIEADFDALTEWQLFCKIGKEINKIIDSQNIVGEQAENLTNAFNNLKNYVDDYFKNLDVQDEINNKLNEMAQDGTLQEIIAEYLNTKSLLGFDNVSDMINSENLIEGSYAQTFGFHNINDGGSKKYKIIKEQNAQNVNGMTKINMGRDNLYAIAINDVINVKEYGAYGDGVHNDQPVIQALINKFKHRTIYFPAGTYLINDRLIIKSGNINQVDLKLETNAVIKTNSQIEALLEVGTIQDGDYDRYSEGATVHIIGGVWDATNCVNGIVLNSNQQQTTIDDITLINNSGIGIYLEKGTKTSGDFNINNSSINGIGSDVDNVIGIKTDCYDNKLNNLRINKCQIGIFDNSSNYYENIHILWANSLQQSQITKAIFEKSIGWKIGPGQSSSKFLNCFSDTMSTAIEVNSGGRLALVNFQTYFWFSPTDALNKFINFKGQASARIILNNIELEPYSNANYIGIDLSAQNKNFRQYFPTFPTFQLSHIEIRNLSKLQDDDYIFCRGIYTDIDEITLNDAWVSYFTYNQYMPIAILKDGIYDLEIRNSNDQIIRAKISVGDTCTMSIENIMNNIRSGAYKLAICNYAKDSENIGKAFLCVTTTIHQDNTCPYNISIKGMRFWNQQLYTRRNFHNKVNLSSPTVNVEASFNP